MTRGDRIEKARITFRTKKYRDENVECIETFRRAINSHQPPIRERLVRFRNSLLKIRKKGTRQQVDLDAVIRDLDQILEPKNPQDDTNSQ